MAKREIAKVGDVIDVGGVAASEEEVFVREAGAAVLEFLKGVAAFFVTARNLEAGALEMLAESKALKVPANGDEDLELQKWIRRTSVQGKAIEDHWKITTMISKFHRTMTGKRAIAGDAVKAANDTGNRLHADYVKAEERRVAAENARRQQEAEDKERERQQRESDRLEEEAVRREEAATGLSIRETTFVELYMARGDGISAARSAGFKTPAKDAARLLTLKKIQDAIAAKKSAAEIRRQAVAVKSAPIVADFQEARPDVQKAAGSSERVTKSAELLDEAALIEAIFSGRYGIPRTILKIDQTALNGEARNLGEIINRWPGVRYKETPRVI